MAEKIKLDDVRLSYEHIFQPTAFDDSQSKKYSATLIIRKDHPQLQALKSLFKRIGAEKWPQAFQSAGWPQAFTCALRDADKDTNQEGVILAEKNPEYKGCYILKADSTRRPNVYDRRKRQVTEEDGLIYSGCYVNVSIGVGTYEFGKVKKGVKAYLNGLQFMRDGEAFGVDSSNDFDDLGADETDAWDEL